MMPLEGDVGDDAVFAGLGSALAAKALDGQPVAGGRSWIVFFRQKSSKIGFHHGIERDGGELMKFIVKMVVGFVREVIFEVSARMCGDHGRVIALKVASGVVA